MGYFGQSISIIKRATGLLKSNRTATKVSVSLAKLTKKNLASIDNKIVQKGLEDAFSLFSSNANTSQQLRLSQIDDIIHKYNQCNDKNLKDSLLKRFAELSKGSSEDKAKTLDFIEGTLDALNCADGLYAPLYNIESTVKPKLSDKIILFLRKIITNKDKYIRYSDIGSSEPMQLIKSVNRANKNLRTDLSNFENYIKFNPLESFIKKYKDTDAELIEYLYESAYINKQKMPALKDFCNNINKKFGIKTFDYTFFDFNKKSAYKIEKELEMFHKILKPKENIIDVLRISDFDSKYVIESSIGGYYNISENFISLPFWKQDSTFRHELIHAIDKKIFKWLGKTKLNNSNLETDLIKGGASEHLIGYSKTQLAEMKAVLGQFYTPKYTKETKDFMVRAGLPKEVLKLRDIDFYNYLVNLKPWSKTTLNQFKEIRVKLGGKVPEDVCQRLQNATIEEIKEILKQVRRQKHVDPKRFIEIFDCNMNIRTKKADIEDLTKMIEAIQKKILAGGDREITQKQISEIEKLTKRIAQVKDDLKFTEDLLEQALNPHYSCTAGL